MLRGDIVKDDSGAYAVFTEQGSSASQMTAAKVMDITRRQRPTEKEDRERQDEREEKGRQHFFIVSFFHFFHFLIFLSFFCFSLVQVFDYRYRFPVVRNYFLNTEKFRFGLRWNYFLLQIQILTFPELIL